MVAVQELEKQNAEQAAQIKEIDALKASLAAFKAENAAFKARLDQMSQMIGAGRLMQVAAK